MKVLVACEFSGVVRDAFRARGHAAWSCDLLPTEKPGPHLQQDVLDILDCGWDLVIAHPPCTHLASSGARWFKQKREDGRMQQAFEFFMSFVGISAPFVAIENPVGVVSKLYRKPDQIIQPYWFGDSVQKATCLWLKGLPILTPTKVVDRGLIYVDPRGNKHGGVHTLRAKRSYSPLMSLSRSEERWKIRSRTFQGVAEAMAVQWGNLA